MSLPSLTPIALAPPPTEAPACFHCSQESTLLQTRYSNRKGNAGRPFYKCVACDQFLCFADWRGNDPNNPLCHCGQSSKRQVAGYDRQIPRGVHYVCRLGSCDFYAVCRNSSGGQVAVQDALVRALAGLSII
jgi:hypothetical protein